MGIQPAHDPLDWTYRYFLPRCNPFSLFIWSCHLRWNVTCSLCLRPDLLPLLDTHSCELLFLFGLIMMGKFSLAFIAYLIFISCITKNLRTSYDTNGNSQINLHKEIKYCTVLYCERLPYCGSSATLLFSRFVSILYIYTFITYYKYSGAIVL